MADSGLYRRCLTLLKCTDCERHVTGNAFDTVTGACEVCDRKQRKIQRKIRYADDNVITEIDVPTDDSDVTYERFIARSRLDILKIIDEHVQARK